MLDGGSAADSLTCGAGKDLFRFSAPLGNGDVDRITDFDVAEDAILLDDLVFEDAGGDGPFAAGAYNWSAAGVAYDADDRIVYDTDSGALFYDVDGAGDEDAIQYARLNANLNILADDFILV